MTSLSFATSSWLTQSYFPNSGRSGIPEVIAARRLYGLAAHERLVSLRVLRAR